MSEKNYIESIDPSHLTPGEKEVYIKIQSTRQSKEIASIIGCAGGSLILVAINMLLDPNVSASFDKFAVSALISGFGFGYIGTREFFVYKKKIDELQTRLKRLRSLHGDMNCPED